MKKSLFLITLFLVFMYPVIAQVGADLTESVPEESLTLKKGNIPPQIIKAADELFRGGSQVEWGVFPYELKDYGWLVNKEYNDPIDHYEIHLKTSDGSDAYVVFESTGELISYRVSKKNAPVPASIMASIMKSPYKDWKISSDVMLIKNNQKKVSEHYAIRLANGNQKKTLYFNLMGDILPVK
jgi:hypothetical protein